MTISFRRTHPVAAGLVAALALAACGQNGPAAGSAASQASATATTQPVRALQACFGTAPAGWAGSQRASFPTTRFDPQAIAASGDRAYGSYLMTAGEKGVAAVDLTSGALNRLVTVPAGSAGVGALAAAPPWLAWVQAAGQGTFGPWTLEVRNLDTGEQTTVASGPAGVPHPEALAMRGADLAWTQRTSPDLTVRAAEVHVIDLAAHRQSVLDPGAAGPPVFAGPYLVWTHASADGMPVLQAVAAETLLPAALPEPLRAQTGISELAGSAAYLVWDTDNKHGTAWRIDRDQLTTFTVDGQHQLQFFSVAGHFLLWYTPHPSGVVMDLDTGGGYDMPGLLAGSEGAIVQAAPLGASNPKSGAPGTTLLALATPSLPAIPGCRR
ncbi:MAG TPA: hypothetical protein VKF59_14275 [Candidatus Dormibacteraeota bacterium]|nr:hypothetical protein [Candidatus Dormibacteraeota bacterium]